MKVKVWVVFVVAMLAAKGVYAETFFSEDFESELPTFVQPQPAWSWKAKWTPVKTGMPHGVGDFYDRTDSIVHRGKYSMKLDYNGRNDFGNTCIKYGSVTKIHGGVEGGNTFVADDGSNLATVLNGAGASPGSYVWNKSASFERWTVATVDGINGETLTFQGGTPSGPGIDGKGTGVFSVGDVVRIGRICPPGERRNDMNLSENKLTGHTSNDFPAGGSIFTRLYFYVPSKTKMPGITQKLIRVSTKGGQARCSYNVDRGVLGCCNSVGGVVPKDKWLYVEMQVKSASAEGADDGICRVWFAEDGVINAKPFVNEISRPYFGIKGPADFVTIGANNQNMDDAIGEIYYDDIIVSSERVGPMALPDAPRAPGSVTGK